ncbi:MAG: Gfo/Idh/MocA family oxidoreductase [Lachnospiraceae bacterium]|nr:Gfo/Idh/MocA family oxidoreductase [Lachnospiraceae bacterium]
MGKVNIGIMGAGGIASVMAETVNRMKGVKLYAVASREKVRADVFAGKHGCKKAYGSYAELAADNKVDLIYIATPHSEHFENAKLCLINKKPVLCEKAFTANAYQAEELFRIAQENGVFITEAMWTRYMPMLTTIREVLGSGVIGEPKTLTANLGYVLDKVERLQNPALAGGALLDVGVYTLNFALMLFGNNIDKIHSCCTYADTGVDQQNTITIQYMDGKCAVLNSSMVSLSDRKGIIYGTKGFAIVENINNFESISVYDSSYKKVGEYKRPKQISGYEYEVEACIRAIRNHQMECVEMPHSETIRVMKIMDNLRKEWGIAYPFEKTFEEAAALPEKEEKQEEQQEEKQEELAE